MTLNLFAVFLIMFAGSMAALQAPMNAALGRDLGSATGAATISFGVGFLALLAMTMMLGEGANLSRALVVNRWLLIGGILGAFYVWAILWSVPVLGVVTAVSAMILGQLLVATLLDATGAFGQPIHDISLSRVAGIILVGLGLVLTKV
jgi:transporter family-2 protein